LRVRGFLAASVTTAILERNEHGLEVVGGEGLRVPAVPDHVIEVEAGVTRGRQLGDVASSRREPAGTREIIVITGDTSGPRVDPFQAS